MTGNIITEHAPAKVNLYLRICGRRDDGYHLLDSAVIFTAFGDQISLAPAASDSLTITGAFAPALDDNAREQDSPDDADTPNLCLQTLAAFRAAGGVIAPMAVTLEKRIPVGAGLGGGSADAAAMLRALNAHAERPVTSATLHTIALNLGADVPACLHSQTLRMTGIGDQITSLSPVIDASATSDASQSILLANPLIPLATRDVFRTFTSTGSGSAGDIDALDVAALATLGNDLEAMACLLVPEITRLLGQLRQQRGCQLAAMSGSGASCFALFDSQLACTYAQENLRKSGVWAVATHII